MHEFVTHIKMSLFSKSVRAVATKEQIRTCACACRKTRGLEKLRFPGVVYC